MIKQPITRWKEELKNDFEESVFKSFPAIEGVKKELYETGAIYATMSGSGSSVFGIFDRNTRSDFSWPVDYKSYIVNN
ncbi:MAG TPA: hypothetical protein VLJ41_05030, partial [Segetibacter sp.]|nr:hypothetical protein [Segetibacter sp.]